METEKESYAGFLFAASHDVEPKNGGVLVALTGEGTVFIAKKGIRVASVYLGEKAVSAYLTVRFEAGAYEIYLADSEKPCLLWTDTCRDGGVVSLVSENSKSGFCHVLVEDTSNESCPDYDRDSCHKQKGETGEGYIVSRNGVRTPTAKCYTETAIGDVFYQIEPFLDEGETYIMELDLTVHTPASPSCFPIVYFRGNPSRKMGVCSDGTHTSLIDKNRHVIADVDAESTFVYAKQQEGVRYHIAILSEPDRVTVRINDTVIYRNMCLSDCLSGDFSKLPIIPEIVCIQGQTGTTRTVIENIEIHRA